MKATQGDLVTRKFVGIGIMLVFGSAFMTAAVEVAPPQVERSSAVDVSLMNVRVTPGVDFTLQSATRPLYSAISYGADLLGWLPMAFLPFVAPAVGIDYTLVPVRAETSFSTVGVGLGTAFVAELGRLQISASMLGGGYFSFMNQTARDPDGTPYADQSGAAGYLSAGADVSYLITPYLSLGIGGLYHNMLGLYRAARVHVNATLNVYGLRRHVGLRDARLEPVFPVLLQYYGDHAVGSAVVTNEEEFPISNVQVALYVPEYMNTPHVGTRLGELQPGESADVQFTALFTDRVLTLQEDNTLSAELTVRYQLNGREHETVIPDSIRMHNRNGLTWDDDRKAAAFVSSKDPEIIRFASAVAGVVRREGPESVNPNLRLGMGMFEALSLYGLSYVIDPNTPAYIDAAANESIVDFLQFPRQTFDYRGGDCDDLSILYTALLEAVGVPTAFVTIPGHIYTAFSLGVSTGEAQQMFMDDTVFMDVDGEAWLPVEVTLVGRTFTDAWTTGAKQWFDNLERQEVRFYPMSECWRVYPPSGYPVEGSADQQISVGDPNADDLTNAYRGEVVQLVQRQLYPQVQRLRESINTSRSPERLLNRLGVLYAQYGLEDDARGTFEQALRISEYPPAIVNLANLYYLSGDLQTALTYYERAALAIPDEPSVLLSLARINYELNQFAQARVHFAQLEEVAPETSEEFGYLASVQDNGARAADVELHRRRVLWVEEAE